MTVGSIFANPMTPTGRPDTGCWKVGCMPMFATCPCSPESVESIQSCVQSRPSMPDWHAPMESPSHDV